MIVLSKTNIIYIQEDLIDHKFRLIQKTKFFTLDKSFKFDLMQSGTNRTVEDYITII